MSEIFFIINVAPSTIRAWYSNINGSPGLSQGAVQILKRKSDNAGDKKLYACLIMDEMAIKRQIDWDHTKKILIGCVENELLTHKDKRLPVAKQALVYLLNCVNERWKIYTNCILLCQRAY